MNADEAYRVPAEVSDPSVKMIFKQYCYEEQHEKLRPLPLGPSKDFSPTHIDILDRKYDVSFVGQIANNRGGFFREIADFLMDSSINSFFGLYQGFNKGLDMDSYSKILSNTKIAICPHGTGSPETFRFFEAMSASCVVICAKQPDNWIYGNAPYTPFKNNNFPNTYSIVKTMLNNQELLVKMSKDATDYYCSNVAASPVAKYVMSEMESV